MSTDTTEKGLETLIMRHMTGTGSLQPLSIPGLSTVGAMWAKLMPRRHENHV